MLWGSVRRFEPKDRVSIHARIPNCCFVKTGSLCTAVSPSYPAWRAGCIVHNIYSTGGPPHSAKLRGPGTTKLRVGFLGRPERHIFKAMSISQCLFLCNAQLSFSTSIPLFFQGTMQLFLQHIQAARVRQVCVHYAVHSRTGFCSAIIIMAPKSATVLRIDRDLEQTSTKHSLLCCTSSARYSIIYPIKTKSVRFITVITVRYLRRSIVLPLLHRCAVIRPTINNMRC